MPSCRSLLLVVLLVAGCQQEAPPPVALGTLEWDRVELVAEASEPIVAIHVADGQAVIAGEPVVQLDDQLARARLKQFQAAAQVAQARLDEVLRGPRAERIAEARAALEGAESLLAEAELEFKRQSDLVKRGLGSVAARDRALALKDSARASRDGAREGLRAAEEGSTDEEIRQARFALDQASAAVDEQKIRVERLLLKAPADARVDDLPFEVGERPRQGETVAVLLSGPGPYALAWLPEPYKAEIGIGDALPVRVDGVSGTLTGEVRQLAREAAFTPYYALSERDRSKLVYRMEVALPGAEGLSAGTPLQVILERP